MQAGKAQRGSSVADSVDSSKADQEFEGLTDFEKASKYAQSGPIHGQTLRRTFQFHS